MSSTLSDIADVTVTSLILTDWDVIKLQLKSPFRMRTACKHRGIVRKPLKHVMFCHWHVTWKAAAAVVSTVEDIPGCGGLQIKIKNVCLEQTPQTGFWLFISAAKQFWRSIENIEIRGMNALSWRMKILSPLKKQSKTKKQWCTHTRCIS